MSELTLIEKNAGNKKEEAQVLVLVPARVKKKKIKVYFIHCQFVDFLAISYAIYANDTQHFLLPSSGP